MDRRIKRALEIIGKNCDGHMYLNQIAADVNLSLSRFQHLFKQEMGQTYRTYLRDLRVTRAKDLLTDWNKSIKQVAHKAGYSYAPNFVRDFKKRFGKTPSQYRREIP